MTAFCYEGGISWVLVDSVYYRMDWRNGLSFMYCPHVTTTYGISF